MMSAVLKYLKQNEKKHLEQLKELLAIPSISTDKKHAGTVRRAATWVQRRLEAVGCTRAEIIDTPGHPIVYGEWLGAPERPTVLVYGHYDVQPVDPEKEWNTPPFKPTVRKGRIYARGASDDKGQFITHVNALGAHLNNGGTCPVNVKFLIEGEEEIGSPNLESFLRKSRSRLACDAVVVSDTAMLAKGVPSLCYGLRGLAYLEITVTGSSRDLHSGSFGGAVVNPANALVQMLAALKDAKGRISVPGFYDRVKRLTVVERRAFSDLPHSDRKFKKSIGAPELQGEAGYSTLERIWARPSLDVNGIWSGFTQPGAKTVIPATAHAKLSMRLVPDQTPKEIFRKVSFYLKKLAPRSVKVRIEELHGGDPWVTPLDHPALQAAGRALERAFKKQPVFVREGGSIPVIATFDRVLKVPTVLIGFGLHDDNLHAPNEKLDVDNFYKGMETSALLMEELAESAEELRKLTRTRRGRRASAS
jgi:acetylornithine deacetylase/succinyl-diaminopimelate desuccinylase-like protein